MSISFNTEEVNNIRTSQLVFQSSGTGANSKKITLNAPTSVAANRSISMYDPLSDSALQFGRKQVITAADGANALTVAQSGSLVLLSTANAGTQITLPAIATSAGCNYDLVLATSTAGTDILVNISGTATDGMIGSVIVAGAEVPVTANGSDSITFVSGTAVIGDQAYLYCTGTKWVVRALGDAAGSITVQN